jgi:hypothetical protein
MIMGERAGVRLAQRFERALVRRMLGGPFMTLWTARTATRMSGFLAIAWIAFAGCDSSTSLDGPVMCGSSSCGSGQLCRYQPGGIDAGAIDGGGGGGSSPYYCDDNTEHCTFVDCSGNCSACLCAICGLTGAGCQLVEVVGREVRCPGQ